MTPPPIRASADGVKLDWNINDDHILEIHRDPDGKHDGFLYCRFDYQTNKRDYIRYNGSLTETDTRLYVGKSPAS